MMMKWMGVTLLTASTLTMALSAAVSPAQADSLPKWACEGGSMTDNDSDVVSELTTNPLMVRVLQEYRARWDASYIRQQCDAAASGEPANISCLKGRRDWDAIQSMVPAGLDGAGRGEIGSHLSDLQREDDGLRAAFAHCRDLGIIK